MAREIESSFAEAGETASIERDHDRDHGGPLKDGAEALGALFATMARLAMSGVEAWTDRKAERRGARLRSRPVPDRRPRLSSRDKSGRG